MKARLSTWWDTLHSSFWFVPALMTLLASALALVLVDLEGHDFVQERNSLYSGGVEGARSMLSAIASSVLSLAGVTFSITIAALTLASGQFGPRLLRNFIRDRGNQFVLGAFIGTFMYCLLVLRAVRGVEENRFVPHLSVTVAVALAVLCVSALIYFVHHISQSIQAAQVIATVGNEFDAAVERLFPCTMRSGPRESENTDDEHAARDILAVFEQDSRAVAAQSGGYVQSVDGEGLMKLAVQNDCILHLPHRPGALVIAGDTLTRVSPAERLDDAMKKAINGAFSFGVQRTDAQDALFPLDQLSEIAVRALSPGINDPFTAMRCLDRQGQALALLAQREIPSGLRYDDNGCLRVITHALTFAQAADAAFDPIRHYASDSAAVSGHILEIIARVAPHLKRKADRATLHRHAEKTLQAARSGLTLGFEISSVEERHATALNALRAYDGGIETPHDSVVETASSKEGTA